MELVAAVCLAERGENVTDLAGRDLVELAPLVRLYPVKVEGETLEVEEEVGEIRRERVEGMLSDRCDNVEDERRRRGR